MIQTLLATRYLTPLREGGSLPAIVEAENGELYVMKFVGAGQGAKALIAELVAGEIGRALGLAVPEIVLLCLDPQFGRTEGDPEIQALLQASAGINLGLRYLPKAFAFSPLLRPAPDRGLASAIVWFDAYITNVDRTPRNTNLLLWNGALWLIDHGAALYFHHSPAGPDGYQAVAANPFPFIKHHVLLPLANALPEADIVLRERLTQAVIDDIIGEIPRSWLVADGPDVDPATMRGFYRSYLLQRLQASERFVEEAIRAQR
jgi:hypothetical protein